MTPSASPPVARCAYCGHRTVMALPDTAGVLIPVCAGCQRSSVEPPPHDPAEPPPAWRSPAPTPARRRPLVGLVDPASGQPLRSADIGLRLGLSRGAVWKRWRAGRAAGLKGPALAEWLLRPPGARSVGGRRPPIFNRRARRVLAALLALPPLERTAVLEAAADVADTARAMAEGAPGASPTLR